MKHPAKLSAVEAWLLKDAVVDGTTSASPLVAAKRLIKLGYVRVVFPGEPRELAPTRAGKLRLLDPAKLIGGAR